MVRVMGSQAARAAENGKRGALTTQSVGEKWPPGERFSGGGLVPPVLNLSPT